MHASNTHTEAGCPFCSMPAGRILGSNAAGYRVADLFPVAVGHGLVIPHRHVANFFDLTDEEWAGLLALLRQGQEELAVSCQPDGFTVGVNVGVAAGQTVPHAHLHLIPRNTGDVPDATGGVRGVIPGKARY